MAMLKSLGTSVLALAGAGIAYASTVDHNQALLDPSPSRLADPEGARSKLSIYADAEPTAVLVPVKSPLQDDVHQARIKAQSVLQSFGQKSDEGKSRWLALERSGEESIRTIISPHDDLNPNLLYVTVTALAGSILGRSRGMLMRATLPPVFLLAGISHFLPHTWINLYERAERIEAAHLPGVREGRAKLGEWYKST
ncbi:hypothetical protein JCM11641_003500 [Rhodosporidiobolus odoratus]